MENRKITTANRVDGREP